MRELTPGLARWRRRRNGQSLVEFALVAPFLILLVLGAAQVGLLVYDQISIGTASREGARVGAQNPSGSTVFIAPPQVLIPACTKSSSNPVCVAIYNSANNSSGLGLIDTNKITAVVSSSVAPQGNNPCPLSGAAATDPNDGLITVTVQYPAPIFVPLVGQFFADSGKSGQRTLSASVTMRIEPCTVTQGS